MKCVVVVLAVCCCGSALADQPAAVPGDRAPVRSTPFPDVPRSHWAFDAVEQLRQPGIVRGYPPAQTFAPPKTRAPRARKPQHR